MEVARQLVDWGLLVISVVSSAELNPRILPEIFETTGVLI